MEGWVGGWMDGGVDEWTDGWKDAWMDGCVAGLWMGVNGWMDYHLLFRRQGSDGKRWRSRSSPTPNLDAARALPTNGPSPNSSCNDRGALMMHQRWGAMRACACCMVCSYMGCWIPVGTALENAGLLLFNYRLGCRAAFPGAAVRILASSRGSMAGGPRCTLWAWPVSVDA